MRGRLDGVRRRKHLREHHLPLWLDVVTTCMAAGESQPILWTLHPKPAKVESPRPSNSLAAPGSMITRSSVPCRAESTPLQPLHASCETKRTRVKSAE